VTPGLYLGLAHNLRLIAIWGHGVNPLLASVSVVLVETTHPGNIGAVARAMCNMGLADLRLVNPRDFPSPEASARAAGGIDLLASAKVFNSLEQAIADCGLVVGTSARPRTVQWPVASPAEASVSVLDAAYQHRVALLFGRESRGLTNRQLDHCQLIDTVPVNTQHPSLNLASAVLLFAYELHKAAQQSDDVVANSDQSGSGNNLLATAQAVQGLFAHLESVLHRVDFLKNPSDKLLRKIRRIFTRRPLEEDDVNILRGVLSAVEQRIASAESQRRE